MFSSPHLLAVQYNRTVISNYSAYQLRAELLCVSVLATLVSSAFARPPECCDVVLFCMVSAVRRVVPLSEVAHGIEKRLQPSACRTRTSNDERKQLRRHTGLPVQRSGLTGSTRTSPMAPASNTQLRGKFPRPALDAHKHRRNCATVAGSDARRLLVPCATSIVVPGRVET
jgi:hypothetical protein